MFLWKKNLKKNLKKTQNPGRTKTQLKAFLEYIGKQANTTRTNNIILTMGGDFTYMDAGLYYENLDRLIR